ncbi:MAG: O-antigen polysaccharide polymerase Wzy [Eubacteriales bacterium]
MLKTRDINSMSESGCLFWIKIYGVCGWISLGIALYSWTKLRKEFICLYNLFLLLLYLFTYAQCLLFVFDLIPEIISIFRYSPKCDILNAEMFTILSLICFHIGALICCKKPNLDNYHIIKSTNNSALMNTAIKKVGLIFLAFSAPSFFYNLGSAIIIFLTKGYRALYGYDEASGLSLSVLDKVVNITSDYFIPALICLLIAYKSSRKKRNIILYLLYIEIAIGLFLGGRGNAIALLLMILVIHHYTVKQITFRKALKYSLYGYFLISFLTVIAQVRGEMNPSILKYILVFFNSFGKENLFITAIAEMGFTLYPLIMIMKIVPVSYGFLYGKSYLYSFTSIIPNLGFWDIHPATVYSRGGVWLMDVLNLSFGPGYTACADAFRNFGWWGFWILTLFGMLFGKIYSSVDKNTINNRPEIFAIVMIFAYSTLMFVRGDNVYLVRPTFYIVLPIFIMIKLIYNGLIKSNSI